MTRLTGRQIPTSAWTTALGEVGFSPADGGMDYATHSGSRVLIVLERRRTAVRDIRSAMVQLGMLLAERDRVTQGCLVLVADRLTSSRVQHEWVALQAVFRQDVADRLALVVIGDDYDLCLPEARPDLVRLAEVVRRLVTTAEAPLVAQMPKQYGILKVLAARWLVGERPISRKALGEMAGCSYPTVAKALEWLGPVVRQTSDRSVELNAFPRAAWSELLALLPSQRGRLEYVDRSGRSPDLDALLRRLQRLRPANVALGGVIAAHRWDPHFDLRGLPRLDLTVHAAPSLDLGFLRRLDPALGPASGGAPVLVLHPVQRPVSLFVADEDGGLPFADPVETLLDLSELRLLDQGNALIDRLERTRRIGA